MRGLSEPEEARPHALLASLHFGRGAGLRRSLLVALLVEARDGVARFVRAEDVDRLGRLKRLRGRGYAVDGARGVGSARGRLRRGLCRALGTSWHLN